MSALKMPDDPGLSSESWRPKFYGLIKEGRKSRLSEKSFKIVFFFIAVTMLSFQLIQVFKTDSPATSKDETIKAPLVGHAQDMLYVPPVTSALKEVEAESRRNKIALQKNQKAPKIDRIQAINLSQTKEIPSGVEVIAELSSGASNGLVTATISENLKFDGDILLTKGTTLIGQGSSNEDRLYIQFSKAVSKDKSSLPIKAFAFDKTDRILGLKGKKISDYAFKLAASAGLIFLGGVADSYRNDYRTNPFEQRRPTLRDSVYAGASTAAVETGQDMMNEMENRKARMEVPSRTPILVIFGDVE